MKYKNYFAAALYEILDEALPINKIINLIETPKFEHHGDLSFPCFELAKSFRKPQLLLLLKFQKK